MRRVALLAAVVIAAALGAWPGVAAAAGCGTLTTDVRASCSHPGGTSTFSFAAPGNGTTVVDLEGTTFDAVLRVSGGAVDRTFDAADPSAAEHLAFEAVKDVVYEIRVTGPSGEIGIGARQGLPDNDEYVDARGVTLSPQSSSAVVTGHTAGLAQSALWFRFVAPRSGQMIAETCASPGNSALWVWDTRAPPPAGDPVGGSQEAGRACSPERGGPALAGFAVIAGSEYAIEVATGAPDFVLLRLRYDDDVPTLRISSGPPPVTNSSRATFDVVAGPAADLAGLECGIDTLFIGPCALTGSGTLTYSGLPEGEHTMIFRSVDFAGNTSPPVEWTWRIDQTPPETTITASPPEQAGPSATVDFQSEKGASFVCSLDYAPYSPCEPPLRLTALAPGLHLLVVAAIDAAGNRDSSAANVTWSVLEPDPPPPAAAAFAPKLQPVAGKVTSRWTRRGRGSRVRTLRISGLARGTNVSLRCTGPGCPVGRRTTKATRAGALDVTDLIRRASLRPGAVLELTLSRAGRLSRVTRLVFRAPGRPPLANVVCRSPGGSVDRPCG